VAVERIRSPSRQFGPGKQYLDKQHLGLCDRCTLGPIRRERYPVNIEKITVRSTESGQTMEVVVFSKRAHRIEVVLGEGVHSVKCELTPTRNGLAYAGNVLGREIVYERSREQVQADIDRLHPALRRSRPR
jgi:hypothetical protein